MLDQLKRWLIAEEWHSSELRAGPRFFSERMARKICARANIGNMKNGGVDFVYVVCDLNDEPTLDRLIKGLGDG